MIPTGWVVAAAEIIVFSLMRKAVSGDAGCCPLTWVLNLAIYKALTQRGKWSKEPLIAHGSPGNTHPLKKFKDSENVLLEQ